MVLIDRCLMTVAAPGSSERQDALSAQCAWAWCDARRTGVDDCQRASQGRQWSPVRTECIVVVPRLSLGGTDEQDAPSPGRLHRLMQNLRGVLPMRLALVARKRVVRHVVEAGGHTSGERVQAPRSPSHLVKRSPTPLLQGRGIAPRISTATVRLPDSCLAALASRPRHMQKSGVRRTAMRVI